MPVFLKERWCVKKEDCKKLYVPCGFKSCIHDDIVILEVSWQNWVGGKGDLLSDWIVLFVAFSLLLVPAALTKPKQEPLCIVTVRMRNDGVVN